MSTESNDMVINAIKAIGNLSTGFDYNFRESLKDDKGFIKSSKTDIIILIDSLNCLKDELELFLASTEKNINQCKMIRVGMGVVEK